MTTGDQSPALLSDPEDITAWTYVSKMDLNSKIGSKPLELYGRSQMDPNFGSVWTKVKTGVLKTGLGNMTRICLD